MSQKSLLGLWLFSVHGSPPTTAESTHISKKCSWQQRDSNEFIWFQFIWKGSSVATKTKGTVWHAMSNYIRLFTNIQQELWIGFILFSTKMLINDSLILYINFDCLDLGQVISAIPGVSQVQWQWKFNDQSILPSIPVSSRYTWNLSITTFFASLRTTVSVLTCNCSLNLYSGFFFSPLAVSAMDLGSVQERWCMPRRTQTKIFAHFYPDKLHCSI